MQGARAFNTYEYKYGHGGQEKDDEIAQGIYTAEYWEYDSRLGRRWNIDPVIKPWRSGYDAFSNSPICKIDPSGDDDYYNKYGSYLGSDGRGNKIRVVDFTTTIPKNFYISVSGRVIVNKNVGAVNSAALSSLNYNDAGNRETLSAIATQYNARAGIKGVIGTRQDDKSEAATIGDEKTYISYDSKGKISGHYDDIFNLKNTLHHEDFHRKSKGMESNMKHVDIVMGQINEPTWGNTTADFKSDRLTNVEDFLNNSIKEKVSSNLIEAKVNELNDLIDKTGNIFIFDKKANKVTREPIMPTIEVK